MTMVTVPLAVLIGVAVGLMTGGLFVASDNNDTGAYVLAIVCFTVLFVFVFSGIEALIKAGGA